MKRFLDIIVAGPLLLLALPIGSVIAVVLAFTGEGEIFYAQPRIGRHGRRFRLLKFVTMVKDSPNIGTGTVTVPNDPRVLPVGRFLRKTKLNELPQLWNVLRDDMSLVGPRPLAPQDFAYYSPEIQREIVKVQPGLTGVGSIVFRDEEEVLAAPVIMPGAMTRLMACPPTCGGAAAVVVSEAFARRHGLSAPVWIDAQAMTTDGTSTFAAHDMMRVVGYDMAKAAARQVYDAAGIGPEDVDVVELHDCFAQNELITYEALGLCPEGGGAKFVADGDNSYGGKYVTNPSGGLLSKGHPLGATGLAQCYELVSQLRGTAEKRQVEGARVALQHNLGLGGAAVVTLYRAE